MKSRLAFWGKTTTTWFPTLPPGPARNGSATTSGRARRPNLWLRSTWEGPSKRCPDPEPWEGDGRGRGRRGEGEGLHVAGLGPGARFGRIPELAKVRGNFERGDTPRMSEPRQTLRALLQGEPFLAADCFSALTARIVQKVGFKAAYMGGHATSMMNLAIPDSGVFTTTEMIELSGRVVEAIDIPLIVDADQAGDSIVELYRTIKRYDRVGVAGVHIEDEIAPKHSAWDGPLLPVEDMSARIAAACEARNDPQFVIIVRSDELYRVGGGGTGSLDEAIRRGVAMPRRVRMCSSPRSPPRSNSGGSGRSPDPDCRLRQAPQGPAVRARWRLNGDCGCRRLPGNVVFLRARRDADGDDGGPARPR